jgi:adenylate cyclase
MPTVIFQDEGIIDEQDTSLTLLQISLKHHIPHVHACGGNARCSTCRVMIHSGLDNVLPRNEAEQRLADRKGLEDNVRLACQTQIQGPIHLRRLVLDETDVSVALGETARTSGREVPLAILFSDIRDFTPFAEQHLPYDVLHILNRYFYQMGEAVLQNEGYLDKYIGDGMMALFGLSGGAPADACLSAIRAGLQMIEQLGELNRYLKKHFGVEFGIRIGIHFGEAVIGYIGHPRQRQFTAIGDSVNFASRVESAGKGISAPLLIAESVYAHVRDRVQTGLELNLELRGKSGTYKLYQVTGLAPVPAQPLTGEDRAPVLRRRLRSVVSRHLAPLFLRLAFHDALPYDPDSRAGGANGSVHLPEELGRPENKGLAAAIKLLRPLRNSSPEVSWADLIALAGAVAVAQTNGPEIAIPLGRTDATTPGPTGQFPSVDLPFAEIKARFRKAGFTPQELVALSGAHTLGRSQGGIPFTEDLFTFTNSYFRLLLRRESEAKRHLLFSDRALLEDPECVLHVETYALDQDAFFRDFAAAYRKMTLLGTDLGG